MKKGCVLTFLALGVAILMVAASGFADDITLNLIPASGNVSGPPGSTVGWGYTITNNTADWLQALNVSSDPFQNGTPNLIFDFPAVAPDSSVTLDFSLASTGSCAFPPCGLYELIWDTTAPVGFSNTGAFTISPAFYSGDPAAPGAVDLGPAPDMTAAYSATVSPTGVVPEPASFLLFATGVGLLILQRRRLMS